MKTSGMYIYFFLKILSYIKHLWRIRVTYFEIIITDSYFQLELQVRSTSDTFRTNFHRSPEKILCWHPSLELSQ